MGGQPQTCRCNCSQDGGGAFFGDNWTEEGRMRADMSLYEVVGDEGVAL